MPVTTGLRVAVVGAGPAGLCAARHVTQAGMMCVVFEQSSAVGGTWQYTHTAGTDPYGLPVHTSMYRDLRTNVPKDVVMFPGIPHKNKTDSYLASEEILQYLNDYADMFQLRKVIKFNHHVKKLSRRDGEWIVTVVDLPAAQEQTYTFDAIFICNGLNNKPFTPHVEGVESFTGCSLHSHEYRTPEPFTGQRVLIIGGGASALDLAHHISECAHKVILSHHSDRFKEEDLTFRDNVMFKKDVRRLHTQSVEFVDDTTEDIDTLVYCTGFKCNYTFMDESCGISEDEGLVYPLYKHFINANNSSMCILGNMCHSMQFPTFDIQVRFFIKTLSDDSILPERDDMLSDIEDHIQKKIVDGKPKKSYFMTTAEEDADYYADLAKRADIEPIPRVLSKIHSRAVKQIYSNFPLFRNEKYTIIDDDNFSVSA